MKRRWWAWVRDEEWNSFQHSVRGKLGYLVHAIVDERTYTPMGMFRDELRMGTDHPIVWTHCIGLGRAVYSALGHFPESYGEPLHRQMLASAIQWTVATKHPECAH